MNRFHPLFFSVCFAALLSLPFGKPARHLLLILLLAGGGGDGLFAQSCPCGAVTSYTVDLTSNPNNTYTVSTTRSGLCCGASDPDRCIKFIVYVHPQATEVGFDVTNPSPPGGAFYQVDCGTPTSLGTPLCLSGVDTFCLTYCKSGADSPTYTISSAKGFGTSSDITIRNGCTGLIYVNGLSEPTITWTSVFPGGQGAYDSYLSCTSACDSTYVTPSGSPPAYIDYKVCGSRVGCALGTYCDTVRVNIVAALTVSITATSTVVCTPGPDVTLTASASGGSAPYSYLWSTGETTSVISAGAGSYTVSVNDNTAGCAAVTQTITIASQATPSAPTASASPNPVCEGATLSLSASTIAGATYSWSGPNGFSSSSQNPTIVAVTTDAAGTYSVTATVGGCTGPAGTVSVTVNETPAAPTAGSNSPVCEGATLSLTASTISGATYSWSGPNGFSSSSQNPTIAAVTSVNAGTYSVTATVAGCTGPAGTTSVTINPIPPAPTAGNNSPICEGTTLSLTASTIAGATYSWSGPNGFSSSLQNPTIVSVTTLASGTYSVTATVLGCTGPAGTTSVTINPTPAAPTASSNSPVCEGTTLSLTASTISGATYSWSGPNGFSSSSQNPTIASVTTDAAGTYSVTATVLGCTGPAGTTSVTVNTIPAAPTAGNNSPVCVGATLSLTASTISGATYNWNGPNSFSSSLQNPTIASVTSANSGTYSVTATVAGCTGPAGVTTVTVSPIPSAPTAGSNSPVCEGNTLSLTASTISGATYSWNGPNGFSSSSQNPTIASVTTLASGTYSVTATVAGCTGPAGTVSVTVNPLPAAPTASSNGPVCSGQTLSLTASTISGATYSWSGPNGFSSSSQNPTIASVTTDAAGTYSVTATVAGCPGPAGTIAVIVNQTPSAPTAGNNGPLCTGDNLTLTASTIPGVTYSWSGPLGFSSSLQNPTIAGVTTSNAGTYSVYVSSVDECDSPIATTSVTIEPPPPAPTAGSNSPVCTGQTLSLTASTISGATYNWSGPNGFSSSSQNPTIASVTTNAAGTYSVNVTIGSCTGPNGTVSVTINVTPAAPTASSNSPICAGNDLSLTASTVGGATYSWSGPNGFSSSSQNPVITGATTAASGTYSVTATEFGCTGPAGTTSVTVNPIPSAPTAGSNSPVCEGNTLSLTASTVGGATYSWNGPNGFSSSSQNPTIASVTSAEAGTYSVTVTVAGCTGPAGTTSVVVNPPPGPPTAGSNSPVCSGQTLSLTASTIVAASSYSWNGPNGFSSSSQNPTIGSVTTLATGTYSVTAFVPGCGTSGVGTVSVTVNQTPTVTAGNNGPLCTGDNLTLTASTIPGATYSWSGPLGFSSSLQNPTIAGVTTSNAGTYSVYVTSAEGCVGPVATTSVTIEPPPPAPTAGSNSPVCTGQTLSLTASTISGATYNWSGPNGFTSSSQNPTIASVTTNAAGTYSVNVTIGSCTGPDGTVSVTINVTPAVPTASSNSPICAGNDLSLTASTVGGATYSWSGPNGFSSSSQNPVITGATTAASGTYSVTATEFGCTGPAGTTSVTVNPIPSAPTTGSNSPVCEGNTLSLTASTISGATYSWNGPNGFSSSSQNPTIGSVTTLASGTYSVTATVLGCTGPVGTTSVTVNPIPSAPTAGNNSPICSGQTLSLTASTISGATYSWSGPNGFSSSSQNPTIGSVTTLANGTYSVTATVLGCTSSAGTTSVTVNQTPPAPVAGSNSPVCEGNTLSLTASTIPGTTYNWSGPNGFSSSSQNPTIAGVTIVNAGTYTVNVTSAQGCTSSNATTSVTITPTILVNAGADQTVCANNANVSLGGSVSGGTTTGIWLSSGSGTFSPNNTTLNATYIPSAADTAAGTVTLTLTSTNNGGCTAVNDFLIVTITDAPTANAGVDQTVCANNANVSLSGSVTVATGGIWSSSGSGIFSPDNITLNATYIPSAADTAAGTVTIVLTTTGNGLCNAVSDTMLVTITDAPTANAGVDQTVCANNANVSLSGSVTIATGGIWSTSGSGIFSPDNITLNATYIPSAADTAAGTVTLVLTTTGNGLCNAVSDTMLISFTASPSANAGANQTVCANNANVSLNGSVTVATGGIWSSSGSGTFSPDNITLNATYIPSAADTAAGTVTIVLTTTGNGLCNAVSDTMLVTITDAPTANAGVDQTVCANNANVSLSGSVTIATGGIWSSSGSGIFSPNNTTLNATYISSSADTAAGTVTLVLTTTGNGLCNAVSDTMVVTITDAPTVNAGADQTVCLSNPDVALNGSSSTGSGIWATLGSGTFSPNNTTLNATYIPSSADTAAGSVILILTSANNGNCLPVSDTVVLNYIAIPVVNAGSDVTVCANNAAVALSGFSSTGTGQWSSSGTGTFSPNPNQLNVTYLASVGDTLAGSVTIVFTSTGGCVPVSDTLLITITDAPWVSAGPNQYNYICDYKDTIPLNGLIWGATSTGQWGTLGSGTFYPNNTTLNASYILSTADSTASEATLYLTSTNNGNCLAVTDTMKIIIVYPAYANAGPDTSMCGIQITLYGTITGGLGTGYWHTLDPNDGFFFPDSTYLNATFAPVPGDTMAVLILTTTNNGPCPASSDTMIITVEPGPAANAGADLFICKNNLVVNLNGAVVYTPQGQWSTLGTGTFVPSPDSLNATYIPSSADTTAGSVSLVLTTMGNPQCTQDEDTMIVFFTPPPFVNAGNNILVCFGDTVAQLNGLVSGGATTGQWTTLGSGYFLPNDSALNATYILSSADTAAGTVSLVLTSTNYGNCLPVTDTVVLNMVPVPIVAAGPDTVVCANNANITLNGSVISTTGNTGIWTTSGTGTFVPNATTLNATYQPSAADTTAGTVTLVLTSTNTCKPVKDTLILSITPAPVVNAGTDVIICEGQSVSLSGLVWNAAGGQWSSSGNGTFVPSADSLNTTYIPGSNDTALVIIVLTSTGNGLCLPVTDTLLISVGRKPIAGIANTLICTGQSAAFTDASVVVGANDTIVVWNWTIDGNAFTSQNVNYTYSSAGTDTVTLIVITNAGCSDTVTQIITINPTPMPSFTFLTTCTSDTVYFTGVSTGNIISWNWDFGDTGTGALQNPAHSYSTAGTFTVTLTVTSDSGCTAAVTNPVTPLQGVVAGFYYSGDCQFTYIFSDTSLLSPGDSIVNCYWDFGDGINTTTCSPSHTYTTAGTYTVTHAVATAGGCSDSTTNVLTVLPLPLADFVPQGGTYNAGTSVVFTDLSVNATAWLWNFGDGGTDIIQNPTYTFTQNGTYDVILIVTNTNGCPDTARYTFVINTNVVAVPSAFTPNGDGVNDILLVRGGPLKEMDFRIYNEWGNELFHSTDQSIGWDGAYKGKYQPAARYIYLVKYTTFDDVPGELKGEVTIIR